MDRNICKECGYENFENALICFGCKSNLDRDENFVVNNDYGKTNIEDENGVAQLLKGISIFILLFGVIGSLYIASTTQKYYAEFDIRIFLYLLISTVIVSALFRGFAEIITILHNSKNLQKEILTFLKSKDK